MCNVCIYYAERASLRFIVHFKYKQNRIKISSFFLPYYAYICFWFCGFLYKVYKSKTSCPLSCLLYKLLDLQAACLKRVKSAMSFFKQFHAYTSPLTLLQRISSLNSGKTKSHFAKSFSTNPSTSTSITMSTRNSKDNLLGKCRLPIDYHRLINQCCLHWWGFKVQAERLTTGTEYSKPENKTKQNRTKHFLMKHEVILVIKLSPPCRNSS